MVYNTSLEAYQDIIRLARRMASFCGVDLLADNYKPNWRTALTFAGCISYLFTSCYSAWYYYPDVFKMLQALAPNGIAWQGCLKLFIAVQQRKFFQGRAKYLEEFHRIHVNRPEDNAVLLGLMVKMHLACRVLLSAYITAVLGFGLYPVYFFVMYGERTFAINVLVPGIDPDSQWGYFLTVSYQIFLLSIAMAGISAFDTTFLIFVCNLAGLVDVFMNKLKELDRLLEKEKADLAEIRDHVREILIDHYGIVSYESDLDNRYIAINLMQVGSSVACLSISLFLCYMTNYLPGYAFILGAIFQLLTYCLLGTIFSVKNDDAILAINGTKWYLLEKSQLKMVGFMLHRCQNPSNLTVGGFAPLNIETFVEIMKTIYQFFAMMINFVN
ncbi:AAEL000613-PA [Aedes aegypti]|uniref:Odorant receptor n=2 Tax=Aedes aegypti TaxID=7159 RepID=Q17NP2_AEDAE|nr:odorant receptor 45 [Aedes aegypti]EAT48361.2 AAEL000613-PA [Aedes aegypti]DAA80387.1 TPA_exp: odorant receptor 45 [Aedes aegypti]